MSVTNLTNTTWMLNGRFSSNISGQFNINGTINFPDGTGYYQGEFITLQFSTHDLSEHGDGSDITQSLTVTNNDYSYGVLQYNTWQGTNTPLFTFTGGDDVENPDLIQWLETNGTQLKVTDLTNTTWTVASGWQAEAGYGSFRNLSIEFNLGSLTGNNILSGTMGFEIGYDYDMKAVDNHIIVGTYIMSPSSSIEYVHIIEGEDTTQTKLIAWLSKYGELQEKITDLTGYTVTVPSGWTASEGYGIFNVVGDLMLDSIGDRDSYPCEQLNIGYSASGGYSANEITLYYLVADYMQRRLFSNNDDITFLITGGADVTKPELIQWFYDNNATFTRTEEPAVTDLTGTVWKYTVTEVYNEEGMKPTHVYDQFVSVAGHCNGSLFSNVVTNISYGTFENQSGIYIPELYLFPAGKVYGNVSVGQEIHIRFDYGTDTTSEYLLNWLNTNCEFVMQWEDTIAQGTYRFNNRLVSLDFSYLDLTTREILIDFTAHIVSAETNIEQEVACKSIKIQEQESDFLIYYRTVTNDYICVYDSSSGWDSQKIADTSIIVSDNVSVNLLLSSWFFINTNTYDDRVEDVIVVKQGLREYLKGTYPIIYAYTETLPTKPICSSVDNAVVYYVQSTNTLMLYDYDTYTWVDLSSIISLQELTVISNKSEISVDGSYLLLKSETSKLTDIRGTTWILENWEAPSNYGKYHIAFDIQNLTDGSYFTSGDIAEEDHPNATFAVGYYSDNEAFNEYQRSDYLYVCDWLVDNSYASFVNIHKTHKLKVTIRGGYDSTQSSLIEWFYQYGTLVESSEALDDSIPSVLGTWSLQNIPADKIQEALAEFKSLIGGTIVRFYSDGRQYDALTYSEETGDLVSFYMSIVSLAPVEIIYVEEACNGSNITFLTEPNDLELRKWITKYGTRETIPDEFKGVWVLPEQFDSMYGWFADRDGWSNIDYFVPIVFTSLDNNYSILRFSDDWASGLIQYDDTSVYQNNEWFDSGNRTIEITDGYAPLEFQTFLTSSCSRPEVNPEEPDTPVTPDIPEEEKLTDIKNTTWRLLKGWECSEEYWERAIEGKITYGSSSWNFSTLYLGSYNNDFEFIPRANTISIADHPVSFDNSKTILISFRDNEEFESSYRDEILIDWLYSWAQLVQIEEPDTPEEPDEPSVPDVPEKPDDSTKVWATCNLQLVNLKVDNHSIKVKLSKHGYADSEFSSEFSYDKYIRFLLDNTTYYSELDMTWKEWLNSSFNDGSKEIGAFLDKYVGFETENSTKHIVVNDANNYVLLSDKIQANKMYSIQKLSTLRQPSISLEDSLLYIYDQSNRATSAEIFFDDVFEKEIPLKINFTIDNVYHEAIAGTKWKDWVHTTYNTCGYSNDISGLIYKDLDFAWIADISEEDVIIPGHDYAVISLVDVFNI